MVSCKQNIGCLKVFISGSGPQTKPGSLTKDSLMACLVFDSAVVDLFPYLSAVADQAKLFLNPTNLRFVFKDRQCVLYPDRCIVTPFYDRHQVGVFVEDFLGFINEIADKKESILPRHKVFRNASVVDIIRLLPITNCRDCGFSSCMAFAAAVSQQQATPSRCPHIKPPVTERASYPVYDSEGNLIKTVSLDIDTAKTNEELRSMQHHLDEKQQRLNELENYQTMAREAANRSLPVPLSQREIEVLRMVARGETNVEIGRRLSISPHTVKSHVISIFNKLGVNDRTQASVWAAQHDLL